MSTDSCSLKDILKNFSLSVIFAVVYRTGPLSSKFLQELDVLLADLCSQVDAFILSGDFNIHFELSTTNRMINQALEIMHSYGLFTLKQKTL